MSGVLMDGFDVILRLERTLTKDIDYIEDAEMTGEVSWPEDNREKFTFNGDDDTGFREGIFND